MASFVKLFPGLEYLAEDLERKVPTAPIGVPRAAVKYVGEIRLITTKREAEEVLICLMQQRVASVGLDTEFLTRSDGSIALRTAQLAPVIPRDGGYDIWKGVVFDVRRGEVREALARLLQQPWRFIVHYGRAEFDSLRACGLPVPRDLFDTHLAARLCTLGTPDWQDFLDPHLDVIGDAEVMDARAAAREEQERSLSLVALCERYGIEHRFAGQKDRMREQFMDDAPLDNQMIAYAAEDARVAAALYLPVVQQLAVQGLLAHFESIELPALPVFLDIARQGITVDPVRLRRVVCAADGAIDRYTEELRSQAATLGVRLCNPRSHPQRLELIRAVGFEHLFRVRRGPRGQERFSFERDKLLKRHRDKHPAIEALYRYALLCRIPTDKLFQGEFVGADNRVHSRIEPLGASTGRPSFGQPNLASVPRIFRPAFVADGEDHAIVEIDYSAQEPGIAAAHYGDAAMLAVWNKEKEDFYERMGVDLGLDIPRPRLKVLMLASLYGQTDRSAAESLGVEKLQASRLIKRVFSRYSDLAKGMKEVEDLANVRGYAETRTGLKRYLNPKRSRHARNRQARNLPVQGGGADILKVLLPRAHNYLQQVGGRILVPLFDSLVFQVPREEQQKAVVAISHEMKMAMQFIYPELRPKLDVNDIDTTCWNKDGHGDSVDRFEADPTHDIR